MDAPNPVKKIELLDEISIEFPMLAAVAQNKHAADQAVIEATLAATNDTQSSASMKRRMTATLFSRQDVAAAAPSSKQRFGAPTPPIPFPPLPPLPPQTSGGPDGSVQGWDGSQYEEYTADHTGSINGLMNIFRFYIAHPRTDTFYSLVRYINEMAQEGLLNGDVDNMMSLAGGQNLLSDGIESMAQIAFLMGYTDSNGKTHAPGMDGYEAYLNTMNSYLGQVSASYPNAYTTGMLQEVSALLNPDSIAKFKSEHVAANGDLIWKFDPQVGAMGSGVTYDWTTADDKTKFTITSLILNSGTTGAPNSDIDTLTAALGQLTVFDCLNTINLVWNKYHDVGLMILAFMSTMDGGYLNQESGNADVMDKQHQFDQKYVESIQSIVATIGSWDDTTHSGDTGAGQLQEYIPMLIDLANSSGQFEALQGPLMNFVQNLQTTSVTGTLDGKSYSDITLADVLISHQYTDASGTVHNITADEAATILHDNLTNQPSPYTPPPVPTPTPTPNPNTNSQILQGFINSITSISSAISSSSTQLTTATSEVEQTHQAIIKLGTAVVDPKEGLASVKANAVTRQVSN